MFLPGLKKKLWQGKINNSFRNNYIIFLKSGMMLIYLPGVVHSPIPAPERIPDKRELYIHIFHSVHTSINDLREASG
jgi:hypothetical protein